MAEAEIPTTSGTPASVPATVASLAVVPAVSTPAVEAASTAQAPVVESAPVAKVETPILSAEPVAEVKTEVKPETKVEVKPEVKTEAEKKPEVKPETKTEATADKPVDKAEKPADEKVAAETVESPLPTYEAFKFPETFKVDEKVTGEFSNLLGKLELAKGDHTKTQELGQQLVDLYSTRMTDALKAQTDYFVQIFEQQKSKDIEALRNDPVIGGKGNEEVFNKNMQTLVRDLAKNGGTKEEVTEFRKVVQERGIDACVPVIRVIRNLTAKINQYEQESSNMLAGTKPAPSKPPVGKGIMNALYGKRSA